MTRNADLPAVAKTAVVDQAATGVLNALDETNDEQAALRVAEISTTRGPAWDTVRVACVHAATEGSER